MTNDATNAKANAAEQPEQSEESVHRALGLTDDEFDKIVTILGRRPNHLELAMFSVMWSEHCSYKSSRIHLKRLPTEAPWVLVGPGENAGVIDAGDGLAVALRIESHNHPSAIEPDQGAATGVGGIIRDIFTMGARPIALMDPLRFGPLDDPRSRWIAEGVISGVSGYGNSVGVPTVGGETVFDATYTGNPLVNVFCLGILPKERLVLGQASGVGNIAVLLGSATGRDGIGGVSVLASAGFGDDETESAKRPSVQVGDPFEEKRLIEACLALLDAELVVGIQDLGGAGLTCATSETASRAGMGMDVDLSAIALREAGMEPFEVLTSESQERMLAIVTPDNLQQVLDICVRWEVRAAAIGVVTDTGQLRILSEPGGEVLGDVPASALHDEAPLYHRPMAEPENRAERAALDPGPALAQRLNSPEAVSEALCAMLIDPAWVYSQYDHQLFLNTVVSPGADAAVLRLRDPAAMNIESERAIAISADGNHRWCSVDPRVGTSWLVAESTTNVAVCGARPLALVNCLNFGNPEHPEVMWQLSEAVDGMAEGCDSLGVPVVGGNVSLYNESRGVDIDPTPVVAVLGLINSLQRPPATPRLVEGGRLILLGDGPLTLAGSLLAFNHGERGGSLPPLDFDKVALLQSLLIDLATAELLEGVHDVAEGGVALALAEMAVRSDIGFRVARIPDLEAMFGEVPGRAIVCVIPERMQPVLEMAAARGVTATQLGVAMGDELSFKDLCKMSLTRARETWRSALPEALGSGNLA